MPDSPMRGTSRRWILRDPSEQSWQIEVEERNREKTALITPDGLYDFEIIPCGILFRIGNFSSCNGDSVGSIKWQTCLVYPDSFVVFTTIFNKHVQRLKAVLDAIESSALTLKPQLCWSAFQDQLFRIRIISKDGVRPDLQKPAAISYFPQLRDKKAIGRFSGFCAY